MKISDLITRVGNDVRRTDVSADASSAVCEALRHYGNRPWWFNESTGTFTTTASVGAYLLPSNMKRINYVEVQRSSGEWLEVYHYHIDQIQQKNEGINHTGYPEYYTVYGQEMRLAYIPDTQYLVRYFYEQKPENLSASASNVFTMNLEPVIRSRAAWLIAKGILHDGELAQHYKDMEIDSYASLEREHEQYVGSGKIKPWR